jgi:hypothetical protein
MNIVKILKRKDASAVVVAVVLGLLVMNAVEAWAERPAAWLSGQTTSGDGWNTGLWRPLITLLVQLVVFEILIWVYVALSGAKGKK